MIMIIAIIYIFVIICDILSTVENYYQKIFRISLKKSSPSFLLTFPLKIQKLQVPLHFDKTENFQARPLLAEREGKDAMLKALSFCFVFILWKGHVSLLRYSIFCIFNYSINRENCTLSISISTQGRAYFWIYLLNCKSLDMNFGHVLYFIYSWEIFLWNVSDGVEDARVLNPGL